MIRHSLLQTRQRKHSKAGRFLIPVITVFVLSYFGFHAFHGAYGLKAHYHLENEIKALQKQLNGIQAKRKKIEQQVRLLEEGSLEKDMLDEQSRKTLGVLRSDEVQIIIPKMSEKRSETLF